MQEHELVVTQFFNNHLAGIANRVLELVGQRPEPRPWANFIVMELLVALILVVLFAILRPKLSATEPGKFQHTFEVIYEFLHSQSEEQVGHEGHRYLGFFGTIFFFVLFGNLIGIVPGMESPTMAPAVPLGCALATFLYYNWVGMRAQGAGKYLIHFAGPMPILAPLMVPIELISHLARPLSLTIRLYANMYAGEQVTLVFLGLTYFLVPAVFMGLHVFVSLLQAYIFTLMAMIYVAGAVAEEH